MSRATLRLEITDEFDACVREAVRNEWRPALHLTLDGIELVLTTAPDAPPEVFERLVTAVADWRASTSEMAASA